MISGTGSGTGSFTIAAPTAAKIEDDFGLVHKRRGDLGINEKGAVNGAREEKGLFAGKLRFFEVLGQFACHLEHIDRMGRTQYFG